MTRVRVELRLENAAQAILLLRIIRDAGGDLDHVRVVSKDGEEIDGAEAIRIYEDHVRGGDT